MDYRSLIENYRSIRDYKRGSVSQDILKKLDQHGKKVRGLYPIDTEFKIINDGWRIAKEMEGKAGYHGKPVYAPHYVALLSEAKGAYLQNGGYMMESFLMKARSLGLGVCWVSVESQEVKDVLGIEDPRELVALAAIGIPRLPWITPLKETVIKTSLNDLVFHRKWDQKPWIEDLEQRGLLKALYHIRMAPSWENRQPWKLLLDDDQIILLVGPETNRMDQMLVDGGIMMYFMERIFIEENFQIRWELYPQDLVGLCRRYDIPTNYQIIAVMHL